MEKKVYSTAGSMHHVKGSGGSSECEPLKAMPGVSVVRIGGSTVLRRDGAINFQDITFTSSHPRLPHIPSIRLAQNYRKSHRKPSSVPFMPPG